MVEYEVTLKINSDIHESYMNWLKSHVDEMLSFEGFIRAEIFKNCDAQDESYDYVVRYYVDDMDHLNNYFGNHASRMREEGMKKFSNQFSASRRILTKLD